MEFVIAAAVAIGIGYWAYKNGKRTGSRKGFNAGRRSNRRRRYR